MNTKQKTIERTPEDKLRFERDIARIELNQTQAHAERLAEALRIFVAAEEWPTKAQIMGARVTLAQWEKAQQ